MSKFVEFIGGGWVNGKSVAVYRDGEDMKLCAETTGGKKISKTARLSAAEYESLRDQFYAGGLNTGNAEVTYRALNYMLDKHPLPA